MRNLDLHARACSPYELADWAAAQGLPVFYVDNAWVRILVSAAQARRFCSDVLHAPDALEDRAEAAAASGGQLILEAEEF